MENSAKSEDFAGEKEEGIRNADFFLIIKNTEKKHTTSSLCYFFENGTNQYLPFSCGRRLFSSAWKSRDQGEEKRMQISLISPEGVCDTPRGGSDGKQEKFK